MRPALPAAGLSRAEIFARMKALAAGDVDWRRGRVPLYVFKANDEIAALGRDAFLEFFTENALGSRRAFFGLKRMEDEILAMGLSLFHAPDDAAGFFTTGGSESIIAAVKACRDWTRGQSGRKGQRGNLVVPYSAHPAFTKAARLMDLELKRVPVAANYRADVAAMARAIDADTLMLVGSAPCFSYGTIDPIIELSALAQERGLWLHVDACVGGYLAPFAKRAGYPVPEFDFAVPGVTSLSADLHKFGFCPKPASTVFYRSSDRAACQPFEMDDWPGGKFATATLVGTRPGGAVAGAWATLQAMGEQGYVHTARAIMDLTAGYRRGIEAIGLEVVGAPDLSILCFTSRVIDMLRVAEVMATKGWLPGLVREPHAMHLMLSMLHAAAKDDYLHDLRATVAQVRGERGTAAKMDVSY
ncbi:MAG TPA: aminotransferase class V-fold PLP-dependent enzyme [Casimicrobiaceae bacterium]